MLAAAIVVVETKLGCLEGALHIVLGAVRIHSTASSL